MTKYNNLSATHLGTFISYILRILKSQNITDQNTLNVQYKFGIFTEAIINSRKAKFKSHVALNDADIDDSNFGLVVKSISNYILNDLRKKKSSLS